MNPFQLAMLDLIRKRIPTVVTIVAIAASVACAGMLLRLYLISEARFSTIVHGPEAIIGAKAGGIDILLGSLNLEGAYPDFIPGQLYHTLTGSERLQFSDGLFFDRSGVRLVVPIVIFGQFKGHRIVGTDERFFGQPHGPDAPRLVEGRWFGPGAEVVIGSLLASKEAIKIGDVLPVTAWVSGTERENPVIPLKVVGIMDAGQSAWSRACFSSIAEAQTVFGITHVGESSTWKTDVLHYMLVYLRPGTFSQVAELINHRSVAIAVSVASATEQLEHLTGTGVRLGLGMMVLILLLAGLSVAAVLATRFEGMRVQTAVLRALGFSRREIGCWLLWEGLLLGVFACIIGGLLDAALFPLIRSLLGGALPAEEIVASHVYQSAPIWCGSVAATVLAVVIPLVQVERQDVHSSLKGL